MCYNFKVTFDKYADFLLIHALHEIHQNACIKVEPVSKKSLTTNNKIQVRLMLSNSRLNNRCIRFDHISLFQCTEFYCYRCRPKCMNNVNKNRKQVRNIVWRLLVIIQISKKASDLNTKLNRRIEEGRPIRRKKQRCA